MAVAFTAGCGGVDATDSGRDGGDIAPRDTAADVVSDLDALDASVTDAVADEYSTSYDVWDDFFVDVPDVVALPRTHTLAVGYDHVCAIAPDDADAGLRSHRADCDRVRQHLRHPGRRRDLLHRT